jgi:glycosyltransferase involved in cell wall biosynthesis
MPRVSVVCASYNHEQYVRAAIDSVLTQSFGDFELIVVDDGSADGTVAAIRAVADPRLSVATLPRNVGACIALNHAVLRAQGEYVAVLNSDDLFLPGKLERQVAFLDAQPDIGAVFSPAVLIGEDGEPFTGEGHKDSVLLSAENRTRHGWLRSLFYDGNSLCHPSVLIRRRIYKEIGPYNPGMAQLPDLEFWVRMLMRHQIHVLAEPLVAFRIRANQMNASAARPEVLARDAWEQLRVFEQYLALTPTEFEQVFPEAAGRNRELPVGWRLGRLALDLPRPAAVMFGLNAIYDALRQIRDPARIREFIALSGAYDPFAVTAPVSPDRLLAAPVMPPPARPVQ